MSLIAIIGDTHIGASLSLAKPTTEQRLNSRLLDYKATLEYTIADVAARGVKHLVFTGDLFESRSPPLIQQTIFSEALAKAFASGIEHVHTVIGNHDQTRIFGSSTADPLKALQLPNLHVYDEIEAVELREGNQTIANLVVLPYRDRKWFGVETVDEGNAIIETKLNAAFDSIRNDKLVLAVTHVCFEGTTFEFEDAEFYGENQLFVPQRFFNRADLTIGGHVHTPAVLSQNPYIAYVGSMEKRGGGERHDKVYAIVDTEAKTVEYKKEPCREIYDIKLDYGHLSLEDKLFDRICSDVDEFATNFYLEGSIVKLVLRIAATDDQYVEPKRIYRMLKDRHKIQHCQEIHPELYTERQARNEKITEQIVDTEAFRLYLETAVEDKDLRAEVLRIGTDIIRDVEAIDAAS